ncbi:MAG: RsiV family protein [Muribaculaceae bacterium]
MKLSHLLLSVSAMLMLGACSSKAADTKADDDSAAKTAGTLSFETRTATSLYKIDLPAELKNGESSDPIYRQSVSLVIPTALGDADISELNDSIISIALGCKDMKLNDAIPAWQKRTAEQTGYSVTPVKGTAEEISCFDSVDGTVITLTPDLLVYRITASGYNWGAAHGMSINSYLNFSIKDKKLVTLATLFTPEGLAKLPALIAKAAKANEAALGPTSITALPEGGNFYLSEYGEVVFAYQPYEVASYAQGEIKVGLYPYELDAYLTPEGKALLAPAE